MMFHHHRFNHSQLHKRHKSMRTVIDSPAEADESFTDKPSQPIKPASFSDSDSEEEKEQDDSTEPMDTKPAGSCSNSLD